MNQRPENRTAPAPNGLPWGAALMLILAVSLLLLNRPAAYGQNPGNKFDGRPGIVVFVCEHGSAKSLIASAYFNKLAVEKRLPFRAVFRGINPDTALAVVAQKGLESDGLTVRRLKPKRLTKQDAVAAVRVITLGCALPAAVLAGTKPTNWPNLPSVSENYGMARDEIRVKVAQLVDQLQRQKPR